MHHIYADSSECVLTIIVHVHINRSESIWKSTEILRALCPIKLGAFGYQRQSGLAVHLVSIAYIVLLCTIEVFTLHILPEGA
jgi:hypothetical protein